MVNCLSRLGPEGGFQPWGEVFTNHLDLDGTDFTGHVTKTEMDRACLNILSSSAFGGLFLHLAGSGFLRLSVKITELQCASDVSREQIAQRAAALRHWQPNQPGGLGKGPWCPRASASQAAQL